MIFTKALREEIYQELIGSGLSDGQDIQCAMILKKQEKQIEAALPFLKQMEAIYQGWVAMSANDPPAVKTHNSLISLIKEIEESAK